LYWRKYLVTVNSIDDASYLPFIHNENVPNVGQYYVIVNIISGNIILNAKGKL